MQKRVRLAGFYLFALAAFFLQAYVYYFFLSDIMLYQKLGDISIFVWWGSRSYSAGLFLLAWLIAYNLEVKPVLKWWHFAYWGSHLLIIILLWIFFG